MPEQHIAFDVADSVFNEAGILVASENSGSLLEEGRLLD
jgi:hypothetical protein